MANCLNVGFIGKLFLPSILPFSQRSSSLSSFSFPLPPWLICFVRCHLCSPPCDFLSFNLYFFPMSPQGHTPQTFTETNSQGGADVTHAHTETCASTQAWIQPLGWSLQRGCNEKERHRCLHLIHMMKLRIRYEGEGDLTFTINLLSFSCMLITFGLQFTVNVWEKHLEQLVGRQLGLQRHHWYLGEQCLPGVTDWYQLISKEFLQHTLVPCGNCNF